MSRRAQPLASPGRHDKPAVMSLPRFGREAEGADAHQGLLRLAKVSQKLHISGTPPRIQTCDVRKPDTNENKIHRNLELILITHTHGPSTSLNIDRYTRFTLPLL